MELCISKRCIRSARLSSRLWVKRTLSDIRKVSKSQSLFSYCLDCTLESLMLQALQSTDFLKLNASKELVMEVVARLLQICTSTGIYEHKYVIPQELVKKYIVEQEHFNLSRW